MAQVLLQLRSGNNKVGGSKVLQFSTTAGPVELGGSCPGATSWCAANCYARTGWYVRRKLIVDALRNRLAWLKEDGGIQKFIDEVTQDLETHPSKKYVRIHIAGDFFSSDYTRAWTEIAKRFPDRYFWGYTHSWPIPELQEALIELRDQPNVQLWASQDPDMPQPPEGWRVAETALENPTGLPCPHDQNPEVDCVKCGHCILPPRANTPVRLNVSFMDKRLVRLANKEREE